MAPIRRFNTKYFLTNGHNQETREYFLKNQRLNKITGLRSMKEFHKLSSASSIKDSNLTDQLTQSKQFQYQRT